jgi:hypothetical protein
MLVFPAPRRGENRRTGEFLADAGGGFMCVDAALPLLTGAIVSQSGIMRFISRNLINTVFHPPPNG